MRVPFFLHPHEHLLLFVFLMIAIPTGVTQNLKVVLICISFMARDVEHLSMCFRPFGLFPLKVLCSVHCPFFHWVIDFGEFSFLSSLHILVSYPL
jgi:hypothetical protein